MGSVVLPWLKENGFIFVDINGMVIAVRALVKAEDAAAPPADGAEK